MKTNIIKTLNRAAKAASKTSLAVLNEKTKIPIPGLTVHHKKDHDYLIFEGTTEPQNTTKRSLPPSNTKSIRIQPPRQSRTAFISRSTAFCGQKLASSTTTLPYFMTRATQTNRFGVLNTYSDLLKASKDKILNFQQQVGLVGELTVLLDLMDNGHGAKALDYWKGPEGGLHDFVNDNVWELEVKTSTYPSPVVKVHPIEQLEPIGLPFHLVVVKLKTDPTKGTTLPDWIKNAKGKFTTVKDKNRLDDLLLEVGYSDVDASKYKFAFIHEESIRYKIDATTETLCPLNIKAGVLYDDIRWTLQSSDYTMVVCDPKFWKTQSDDAMRHAWSEDIFFLEGLIYRRQMLDSMLKELGDGTVFCSISTFSGGVSEMQGSNGGWRPRHFCMRIGIGPCWTDPAQLSGNEVVQRHQKRQG